MTRNYERPTLQWSRCFQQLPAHTTAHTSQVCCPSLSYPFIFNQQYRLQLLLRAVLANMLRAKISEGVCSARPRLPSLPASSPPHSCVSRCPPGKDLLKPIITIYLILQNALSTQEQLTAQIITQACLFLSGSCAARRDP